MFVVYEVSSTMEKQAYRFKGHAQRFADKLNANEAATCLKSSGYRPCEYKVTTREDYEKNVVHMVERVNLMTGKKYMEKSNTPNYCSPASEAYWSM